jgi:hypothetical protein
MSNNSSSTGICNFDYQIISVEHLNYIAYQICAPIYFIIGLVTRSISIAAFYKAYKEEKGYGYQLVASILEMFEIIASTLNMLTTNNMSGLRLPGALWFQQNYFLMWYSAVLAVPIKHAFITTSLLISLAMSADRVFALAKPFVYKNVNHKRHLAIIVVISLCIGFSTSIFDMFRYQVCNGDNRYKLCTDKVYTSSTTANVLSWIRTLLRIIANLILIICNIAMVIYYRSSANKINTSQHSNDQRTIKRKATEKSLILLTICDSIFTTAVMSMSNTYYILTYSDPKFSSCAGQIVAPVTDIIIQVAGVAKFFALLGISKQFRETIYKLFSNCKKCWKLKCK